MTDTSTKKTITFLLSFFSSWQAQSKQRASLRTISPQLTCARGGSPHFFNQHISFQAAQMVDV